MIPTKLGYYQTDDKVVITLYEKNIDESNLKIECVPKRLIVSVVEDDVTRGILNTSLYEEVLHDQVEHTVTPQKIEIKLKKMNPSSWRTLEDEAYDKAEAKKKTKDKWEIIANEIEEEEEKEGDVNTLFKSIFNNADDNTRKAMIKSFTESKGTVLSTNWEEIKAKKTEVKPPDCMEFKEYN